MEQVRTRFAPSPTGFLHIGGLRTALFAYLFARHAGGKFILRIEDTDRTRLVDGALEDIIGSLKWIGIEWDEGPDVGGPYKPYLQSERKAIYTAHALKLIQRDRAYKCYCTPERLSDMRAYQKKKGLDPGYDRHCRNLSEIERIKHEKRDDPFVIRLKTPLQGETTFNDLIRGSITTRNKILDDLVLIKSDGFPTYHLANVVDDKLMHISHVIRGEEWISSTPKHVLLYDAFGWKPPHFAHVPVILAPGGGKLSKRHGATMVKEFIKKGYLKEAVLNFIALLGWSLDDKTEFFDMDSLIKYFDIQSVNKAPAVFSYEKLDWFNGMYMRKKSPEELYSIILPYLLEANLVTEKARDLYKEYILDILPLIRERLKFLNECSNLLWFFFDERFEIKDKKSLIPKKLTDLDAVHILNAAYSRLECVEPFKEKKLETALRDLVHELGLKPGQVFMTIRVAITGTKVSPGLFETMRVLGKKRVLARLNDAVAVVQKGID